MNKIIFDKYLEDHKEANDDMYPTHLVLPPKPEVGEAPNFGMKELERHKGKKLVWMYRYDEINQEEPKDFTETFKDFCFSSLFIKEEVITALQEIKVECNNVLEMDVFNRDLHPGMVLEEFKHI
jgi:dynein heavy chain